MTTDAAGQPVREVVVEVVDPEIVAIDQLPGVADAIAAIDAELAEAEARAADVRSAFINGTDDKVTLDDVEAAERQAAIARLTIARRKATVRREAEAARADRARRLVDEHAAALDGSTDAIDEAKAAAIDAVAKLVEVTTHYNDRFNAARQALNGVGPLPEGSAVEMSTLLVNGTRYGPATLDRGDRVGLIPNAITEAKSKAGA